MGSSGRRAAVCYALGMQGSAAITKIPDEDLQKVARAAYRGHLQFPLTRQQFLVMGLNRVADFGDVFIGLDERGMRAVIAAVLAERKLWRARLGPS